MSKSLNILVIDDSEDDRLLYRRALKKNIDVDYVITETDNGEEGLRLIFDINPDCILLDYSMPKRNGVEVLKNIRLEHPFVPVVMLTGQGNEAVAVTAIQAGAQNYIAKSNITSESLHRVIQIAIEHCALEQRIHEQRTSLEIFTRALAHDLKEPVRTIRSFLDLISRSENLSTKARGYFTYIQNAAERMNALIETVYFYTRLEGDSRIERETCDVAKSLAEAQENISQLLSERKAVITYSDLPHVYVNRMQLIQVLQNLLCNAIKHCEATPVINISAEDHGEQWKIKISDNGVGVKESDRNRIFEPFKRLDNRNAQGLGLGLAICKKIVETYGGSIWCEEQATPGTTFCFTLPKASSAKEEKPQSAAAVLSPASPKEEARPLANLLLVDDNEADIELARILLIENSHLNCNLLVARSGQEALSELQKTPIDLMLLDINMPGMDGFELLERMRAEKSMKNVPVVMCSTSIYDKDMQRAKSLEAVGYIAKPAELNRLKPIIEHSTHLQLLNENGSCSLLRAV